MENEKGIFDHHNFPHRFIGESDFAALTVTYFAQDGMQTSLLRFGKDGDYSAYVVDDRAIIPDYYSPVISGRGWLKIYDDNKLAFSIRLCSGFTIYRAGELGCIIQIKGV